MALPTPQVAGGSSTRGSSAPGASSSGTGTSGVAPGTSGAQMPDDGAAIPDVDTTPIPADDMTPSVVVAEMPVIKRLEGAWEQVDCASANGPDFAPGGYTRSVVVIDGASSEMFVYRGFGVPGQPSVIFLSGQFHCEFMPDGLLSVSPSAVRPTAFFPDARTIPIDASTSVTIVPPAPAPGPMRWNSDPAAGTLEIGSKRHRRLGDDIRDLVIRGETVKVDAALDAAIAQAEVAAGTAAPSAGATPPAAGQAGNVDFFGMKVRGRYVAFVIDCSGSMASDGKMQAAIDELRRTILALPAEANVFVMFFNGGALQVGSFASWVQSKSPSCGQLVQALAAVGPGGGTNPIPALEIAFSQHPRPDELFLMTDGMMSGDVRGAIGQLNGTSLARTRVHAIAFGQDADRAALEAIARENSGDFRAVP